jgi:hypothetical protein
MFVVLNLEKLASTHSSNVDMLLWGTSTSSLLRFLCLFGVSMNENVFLFYSLIASLRLYTRTGNTHFPPLKRYISNRIYGLYYHLAGIGNRVVLGNANKAHGVGSLGERDTHGRY